MGPDPELDSFINSLAEDNKMEAVVQVIEDLLQPPTFTVNGQLDPVDEIGPSQLVRLRIVNAGSRSPDYKNYFIKDLDIFLAAIDGINLTSLPKASGEASFAGFGAYNEKSPQPGARQPRRRLFHRPRERRPLRADRPTSCRGWAARRSIGRS